MIKANIIIPFDGNHADIPFGFSRDTRFDNGYYPKGEMSSGYGDTGGANTHTHTFSHTHTVASHVHSASTTGPINGGTYSMGVSGGVANASHSHSGSTGTTGSEVSGDATSTNQTSSENHEPPYYEVIFIKADFDNVIPVNGMVWNPKTSRELMSFHTNSASRFLRGAATGGNAGATGGGSHSHSQTHTHSANSHSHASNVTGFEPDSGEDGMSGPALAHGHTHTFTVQNATQNMNSNSTASTSTSPEPEHTTLSLYKTFIRTLPIPGDIAMIIDGDTPEGWSDCDGTDDTPDLDGYYIKNVNQSPQTGGSATHTHTITHSHTGNGSHSHVTNSPTSVSGDQGGHNGSGKTGRQSHQHNMNSPTGSTTANYNSVVATTSAETNEPTWIKVRFIQMKFSTGAPFISVSE